MTFHVSLPLMQAERFPLQKKQQSCSEGGTYAMQPSLRELAVSQTDGFKICQKMVP